MFPKAQLPKHADWRTTSRDICQGLGTELKCTVKMREGKKEQKVPQWNTFGKYCIFTSLRESQKLWGNRNLLNQTCPNLFHQVAPSNISKNGDFQKRYLSSNPRTELSSSSPAAHQSETLCATVRHASPHFSLSMAPPPWGCNDVPVETVRFSTQATAGWANFIIQETSENNGRLGFF